MPRHPDAPRHARAQAPRPRVRPRRSARRRALRLGSATATIALGAGAAMVCAGSVSATDRGTPQDGAAAGPITTTQWMPRQPHRLTDADLARRARRTSRSADRLSEVDAGKAAELSTEGGHARTGRRDLSEADPKAIARALMPSYGLSSAQFGCLDSLWTKESGWSTHAANPSSSAYGIPQALPGSKMATAGPNWSSNPETQVRWGLQYIRNSYGSACSAWAHSQANNWY